MYIAGGLLEFLALVDRGNWKGPDAPATVCRRVAIKFRSSSTYESLSL